MPGDFDRAALLLRRRTGIVLGGHKREMAERRLSMLAAGGGVSSVAAYLDGLASDAGHPEWEAFTNAFTINHTAFFREQHHFGILARHAQNQGRAMSVWCCACSTGEEAYSIAMTLADVHAAHGPAFEIIATDIDTQALTIARRGVYTIDRACAVSPAQLGRYFHRGTGRHAGMVRIKPVLHERLRFEALNLLSPSWPQGPFDAIFCRNTMIYFDKQTQSRLLERFVGVLKKDGLLFAGHSENFTYLTRAFRLMGQTVYAVA
jgi:chemotaxis protein methyltransferase CheR